MLSCTYLVPDEDAGITFRSSDQVFFSIRRSALDCAEGLATGQLLVDSKDVTDLTESSEVLDLLFQYLYPQERPVISRKQQSYLFILELAEAIEKYRVYPALGLVQNHLL